MRTRFIATLEGMRTDKQGRMVLQVRVDQEKEAVRRVMDLLRYLLPRPRHFVLRMLRNDTGGIVTPARLTAWQWLEQRPRRPRRKPPIESGVTGRIRIQLLLVTKPRLDTIQDQVGRQVVLDTREEGEE